MKKSCIHMTGFSFTNQVQRLVDDGYPLHIIASIPEAMLKKMKAGTKVNEISRSKVTVIPYIHPLSHNFKRIRKTAGVKVVFSAPMKLRSMCARVNNPKNSKQVPHCTKSTEKFCKL